MKKLTILLLLTFSIKALFADCALSGMEFLPKEREISLNSMFIIQGYSLSQITIASFENRKIFLESSEGELIELNLQEILKGKMELTQASFLPSKELKPNTSYTLKYANQTESETQEMQEWNSEINDFEVVRWKTTNKKSVKSLNPNLRITFEKADVIQYGCGPSANAIFNIANKGESEIWYRTEFVDLSTKEKTVYFITEWKDKLYVGHGMCAGAFTFNETGKYKVRFTPMNTDGEMLETTKWTTFESPFATDKNPFK
ncbi:hypothetical protein DF185_08155 [Marinifilum breve]|uniref:SbsA Ig-like domain-containing protein n=1 Tax=Marinifilum breve TaxID=2184082 RepID=A0A2V3ZYF3_9BACT|nr:hypothetical protein [Marinifilum breve]PXY01448.1 hypothetical protein DF185_08155 [Marinifilum breve]